MRLSHPLLAVALLAGCSSGHGGEVDQHLRAAEDHLSRGELARSRADLEAAVALAPERPDIHVRLGVVHAAAGRFGRAAGEFRLALARDPNLTDAYVAWGDALAAEGRRAEAFHLWRRGYVRSSRAPRLLERLAVGLVRAARPGKAVRVFERLGAREPTPAPALLASWGAALEDLGETERARTRYEAALAGDPREPTALLHLGELLARDPSARDHGIELLQRLVRTSPTDPHALEVAGRAYLDARRYDEGHALLRRAVAATSSDGAELRARQDALQSVEAMIPRAPSAAEAPNVLLIVIDTLRADHLGCYGYGRDTTPAIDRLAADGAVFETAISQAPWTAASVATLLTGLYPSVHGLDGGVRWEGKRTGGRRLPFLLQKTLDASVTTLATVLRRHGYRTAAFVSNVYMNSIFGLGAGFDVYEDDSGDYAGDVMTAKRSGDETNARAFRWLAGKPAEPLLLLVHYNDPHWPYDPPAALAARWTAGYTGPFVPGETAFVVESVGRPVENVTREDLAYLIGLYDGEIAHADQNVQRLVERVRSEVFARPWLTVIVADHGEEFLDHGSASHGYTLFDEQLHVPLIVHHPARVRPRRIPMQVRLLDVMPTILELVGIRDERAEMQGQSLVALLDGDAAASLPDAFAEAPLAGDLRAVRTPDGLKLIEDRQRQVKLVFNLTSDPAEKTNLFGSGGRSVDALQARLAAWAQANRTVRLARGGDIAPREDTVVDEATRRRLTALGYVQ